MDYSGQARGLSDLYHVNEYPFIGIMDPLHGDFVWFNQRGAMDPQFFLDEMSRLFIDFKIPIPIPSSDVDGDVAQSNAEPMMPSSESFGFSKCDDNDNLDYFKPNHDEYELILKNQETIGVDTPWPICTKKNG
jgi:hypothetical protein